MFKKRQQQRKGWHKREALVAIKVQPKRKGKWGRATFEAVIN